MVNAIYSMLAEMFVYVLMKVIDLFCYFLDLLPPLPNSAAYGNSLTTFISVMRQANTFFPVVETAFIFCLVITFLFIFIAIKFILKLTPFIG